MAPVRRLLVVAYDVGTGALGLPSQSTVWMFDPVSEEFEEVPVPEHVSSGGFDRLATNFDGTYVISGNAASLTNPYLAVSTDNGESWDAIELDSFTDKQIRAIIWDGHEFIAIGGGEFYTSEDGVTWSARQVVGGIQINGDVLRFQDTYHAIGTSIFGGLPAFGTPIGAEGMAGGVSWLDSENPPYVSGASSPLSPGVHPDHIVRRVAWTDHDNIILVGPGPANGLKWTTNPSLKSLGGFWTNCTFSGPSLNLFCAAKAPGYWVAGGRLGTGASSRLAWAYSLDGKAWTNVVETTIPGYCATAAWFDGQYFWFTAIRTSSTGDPIMRSALFRMTPGNDPVNTRTWKRYDLSDTAGPTMDLCGWPGHWQRIYADKLGPAHAEFAFASRFGFIPTRLEPAHVEAQAGTVTSRGAPDVSFGESGLRSDGSSLDYLVTDYDSPDVRITLLYANDPASADSGTGVAVRWVDQDNFIRVLWTADSIVAEQVVDGTPTEIRSVPAEPPNGRVLVVDANGPNFSVMDNGVTRFNFQTNLFADATAHGLAAEGDAQTVIDSMSVLATRPVVGGGGTPFTQTRIYRDEFSGAPGFPLVSNAPNGAPYFLVSEDTDSTALWYYSESGSRIQLSDPWPFIEQVDLGAVLADWGESSRVLVTLGGPVNLTNGTSDPAGPAMAVFARWNGKENHVRLGVFNESASGPCGAVLQVVENSVVTTIDSWSGLSGTIGTSAWSLLIEGDMFTPMRNGAAIGGSYVITAHADRTFHGAGGFGQAAPSMDYLEVQVNRTVYLGGGGAFADVDPGSVVGPASQAGVRIL